MNAGKGVTLEDYLTIFEGVESALFRLCSRSLPESQVRAGLNEFKEVEGTRFSDKEYHWVLVRVVFYSGFRAATVNAKLDLLRRYFPDHKIVAGYEDEDVHRMLDDSQMIRNERKIRACIENARSFAHILGQHGSFEGYLASLLPTDSFENLMLLKEELQYRFSGLGEITAYHVMTEIGLPVLKPDRVICRIFKRLGLIEDERQLLKTVIQGRRFARATGYPIRYIDIVFALYGRSQSAEFGFEKGICLKNNPNCGICGVRA